MSRLFAAWQPIATVLVGRNVLNHFVAILDGKRLTFELRDP